MKKTLPILVSSAAIMACLLASCSRPGTEAQSVDSTKSQLRVKYFNGGLRDEWINQLVDDFEAKYADYSFESGKKGVQIIKEFVKSNPQVSGINSSSNDVFWVEDTDYYDAVSKGQLYDITSLVQSKAVTGPDKSEDVTIESKMSEAAKTYYNLGTTAAPKYYAIPAYENSLLLNYNIDLFDEKGLYFAYGKTAEGMSDRSTYSEALDDLFVVNKDDKKSAGPDGKEGTFDDGLPATYADMEALCTYMRNANVTPFVWNGYELPYLISLGLTAWGGSSGADQLNLSLKFNGKGEKLLDLDSNGDVQKDAATGAYKYLPDTDITGDNAYMLHQQKGLLDAIHFAKIMVSNGLTGDANAINYYSKSFSPSFSHITAQEYFMNGAIKYNIPDIAMLVDGTWWNSEANGNYGSETDRMTRRYGIMPIPHPTAAQIGEKFCMINDRQSMIFLRNTISEKTLPIAKAFVSYMNSDEGMATFSVHTQMMRLMNYKLSDTDYAKLAPYGKAVYDLSTSSDTTHVDWHPLSSETRKNLSLVSYRNWAFSTSSSDINPYVYFKDHNAENPETYFSNVNSYFKKNWSSLYTK